MSRIYVDEYDKVASIVRGDSPDQCGLFECQQRLFAWCSAAFVLKCQLNKVLAELQKIKGQSNYGLREAMEAEHWEPVD